MGAAVVETAADVMAAVGLGEVAVANVLEVDDFEDTGRADEGVSGGQSEPASDGSSQGMTCR